MHIHSTKKVLSSSLLFTFLYASAVTMLCMAVGDRPFILQVENALYDQVQFMNLVQPDNQGEESNDQLRAEMEKVWLINLDGGMQAERGGGMDRRKLTHLLDLIGSMPSPKAVYLDYLYAIPAVDQDQDRMLQRKIAELNDRLVLPFAYTLQTSYDNFQYLDSTGIDCRTQLVFNGAITGYNHAEPLPGDPALRYIRLSTPSQKVVSCAYLLAERTHPDLAPRVAASLENNLMEINFHCDNPHPRSGSIYHLAQASDIVEGNRKQALKSLPLAPTLILIGRFEELTGAQCLPLEVLPTPVNPRMQQTMLTLNAWLSIVSDSYLRNAKWEILFILNVLLALVAVYWVHRIPDPATKAWSVFILEIAGTAFIFTTFIFTLYLNWHIKMQFAIPLLAFVRCEFLARKILRSHLSTISNPES